MRRAVVARSVIAAAVAAGIAMLTACGRFDFGELAGDGASGSATTDALAVDAPPPFCASLTMSVTFCDDFDTVQPLDTGWTDMMLVSGGQAIASTDFASSPPRSAEHTIPAQTVDNAGVATLEYDAGTASTASIAYDVYFPTRPSAPVELADIEVLAGGVFYYSDIDLMDLGPTQDTYHEEQNVGGTFSSHGDVIPEVTAASWHHLAMSLDLTANTHVVELDGATVASGPTHSRKRRGRSRSARGSILPAARSMRGRCTSITS